MIISKTPYRISFFGGGTDYPSWYKYNYGSCISTTIDKYVYLSLREIPNFFPHNYRISYSIVEEVKKISEIKHKAVRDILKYLNLKKNLEIHYDGDLPSKSGVGSSSSFVVGLLNCIYCFNKQIMGKNDLAKKSIFFEQTIMKEMVGIQDQIASSYGGFNQIKINKKGNFSVDKINISKKNANELNKNLILMFSNKQRIADRIARTFVPKLNNSKYNHMKEIFSLVEPAKDSILKKDFENFGKLLDSSWRLKRSLSKSISDSYLDDLYESAINKGALGGKLLGAGGGGFFLFYVPKNNQRKFLNYFKKFTIIPFNFSNDGSKIIYSS